MFLIQFIDSSSGNQVGWVNGDVISVIEDFTTTYELSLAAIHRHLSLQELIGNLEIKRIINYQELSAAAAILPPITHPDPAHTMITGTGLTHLGSADARDRMHKIETETMTDSMRMFQLGLKNGKPTPGATGVQPEWFYKGDGSWVTPPDQPLQIPDFALDGGEEPEIAGVYVIGPDGTPFRVGFALGNEFSDHVMERQNYLYLAHSKLRPCAFGPELRTGALPSDVRGNVRVLRQGKVLWEKPFLSGEDNMSHSIANLEHHHFKYAGFRRPGDIHIHFFGTATLSYSDGLRLSAGDVVEMTADCFGHPLRNMVTVGNMQPFHVRTL
ncbi:MAG: GguC family protein [Anaerolineae bacterium]|nr:GguC family protein [Anaerolineae bacterium]